MNQNQLTRAQSLTYYNKSSVELEFNTFLDTPKLDDVRDKIEETKLEPILNMIASHPTDVKDENLGRATEVLKVHFRSR